MRLTLFILFTASLQIAKPNETPHVCTHCDCVYDQTNDRYDIQCLGTWPDNETMFINLHFNETFSYFTTFSIRKFSIKNTNMSYLSTKFSLTDLEILDLSNNSISKIDNGIFALLHNMSTLILSHNKIETIHGGAFHIDAPGFRQHQLRSLKSLYLDYNRIRALDNNTFMHCPSIQYLSLAYNPLEDLDSHTSRALNSLHHLKELDISYTQLKNLPEYFVSGQYLLEVLDISGNDFDAVPRSLGLARSLKSLILNNNPIANLTKENGFPFIEVLSSLHMCNMPHLNSIGDGALTQLFYLEELYLSNSSLTNISEKALRDAEAGTWPFIQKLHLNNNKLTHLSSLFMQDWVQMVDLDLSDNPWMCDCRNQWMLEQLLPFYLKINGTLAKQMKCAAPAKMVPFTFYEIKKYGKNMCSS